MDVLQSHKIESEHSDQDKEPTVQEAHVEAVVNPGALLPLSDDIESDFMDEQHTTDLEAELNPGSSLPLLCDSDNLINMEMGGQTEVENTEVEEQASDMVLHYDIMDLFSDYCKQSNIELVTCSQSSGSASPSYIVSIDERLCSSKDNKQSDFKMSVSLK